MVKHLSALSFLVALLACEPASKGRPQALTSECSCPCMDAAIPDASPPDGSGGPISLTTPWTRTIITPGAPTGQFRGADGVARDADGCWVTAWEEGSITTRACPSGGGWATELVATGLTAGEDAKAGDLDGDGVIDVVTCADAGKRCYITFRGASPVTVTLVSSMGHGNAMQAAIGDVDGDGRPDIVFGTRIGAAVVGWLRNPGAAVRDGNAWTYQQISQAGWIMSVVPLDIDGDGDLDVAVSDRAKLLDGTWGLYGSHWKEQQPGGVWVDHPISQPAGSHANQTPGDEMFLSVGDIDGDGDLDVVDCTSRDSTPDSRIVIHRNDGGWLAWTHTVLAPVTNVGHCQGTAIGDIDGDGDQDIVVSNWKGNAYPVPEPDASKSGVYWLRNDGGGVWTRGEISGPVGGKFDNPAIDGNCVMTSEQLDPQGGLGVVRYCPP